MTAKSLNTPTWFSDEIGCRYGSCGSVQMLCRLWGKWLGNKKPWILQQTHLNDLHCWCRLTSKGCKAWSDDSDDSERCDPNMSKKKMLILHLRLFLLLTLNTFVVVFKLIYGGLALYPFYLICEILMNINHAFLSDFLFCFLYSFREIREFHPKHSKMQHFC